MAEATLSSNQTSDTHCVQRGQARKDGELDFPSKDSNAKFSSETTWNPIRKPFETMS